MCARWSRVSDDDAHVAPLAPSEVTSDDDEVTSALKIVATAVRNASTVMRSTTFGRSWWPIVMFTEHLHAPHSRRLLVR